MSGPDGSFSRRGEAYTKARRFPAGALAALAVALAYPIAACSPDAAHQTRSSGVADIGGPFQLVDQTGAPRDQSMLKGKWSLIFFGFTYCPNVCPTTLQILGKAQERLGADAADVQIVFVSVDPERDTPAQMQAYLKEDAFPRDVVGLTGTPEQVAAMTKAYKAYAQKSGEGENYMMDHTAAVYLMNPKGEFDRPLSKDLGPEELANQIRKAMRA